MPLIGKSSLIDITNKVLYLHLIALYIKEEISPLLVSLLVNKIFWAMGNVPDNFKNILIINKSILYFLTVHLYIPLRLSLTFILLYNFSKEVPFILKIFSIYLEIISKFSSIASL